MVMSDMLGSCLKRSRKETGLTLRDVEEKTGISNAYLSQLENQRIANPSPQILHKLADCYDISYEHLMELAGYPVEVSNKKRVLFRASGKSEEITPEEEKELLNYLRFLRMKRREE
jgi:transcriptional regulator with XRE-family HTH domain